MSQNRPLNSRTGLFEPALAAIVCAVFFVMPSVWAETQDWKSNAGTTAWATGSNWVSGTAPLNDLTSDLARFNQTSYALQPTTASLRRVNGLVFGDGTTSTAALTLTTATSTGRLGLGSGGVLMNANSGVVTLGAGTTQGILLGANQTWANHSSSLLTVASVSNIGDTTPFTLTLSGTGSGGITITNVISNGGSVGTTGLIVNATGDTTLSAANTLTGGIALNGGKLIATVAGAYGAAANTLTFGGGNLELRAGTNLALTYTGGINLNSTNETIFVNTAAATNGLVHIMSGSLTMGTQTTTISAGSNLNANTNYGLTLSGFKSFSAPNSNATFTINGNGSGNGTLSLITGAIDTGGHTQTLTFNNGSGTGTNSAVLSGAFTGSAGTLVLAGSAQVTVGALTTSANAVEVNSTTGGAYTFNGASTFTGGVTLTSGKMNINSVGVASTSGPLGNGGNFAINGGTIDNTSGSAKVVLNVNPITIGGDFAFSSSTGTAVNSLTLLGDVSMAANHAITLNGTGSLSLNGKFVNSSDSARTLTVNNGAGTGASTLLTIGSLDLTGAGSTAARNDIINGSGKVTISGVVANGVSAGSGLTYAGTGLLTLAGANTYTGTTTVSGGTVKVTNAAGLGTTANGTVVAGTASLDIQSAIVGEAITLTSAGGGFENNGVLLNSGAGNGSLDSNLALGAGTTNVGVSGAGNLSLSGILSNATSAAGLNKVGSGAGALILTGTNTYTGGTTISAGSLFIGNDSALGSGKVTLSGGLLTNASGALVTLNNNLHVTDGTTSVVRATVSGSAGSTGLTLNGAVTGGGVLQSGGAGAATADATAFKGDFSQFTGTANPLSVSNQSNTSYGGTTAASFNLGQAVLDVGGTGGSNRRLTLVAGTLQVGALQGTGVMAGASHLQAGALNTNTSYSGASASTGLQVTKVGTGTLTLNSGVAWSSFNTGYLTVNGGTVIEDLANTAAGGGIFGGNLKVGGGSFRLLGKSGVDSSQAFASLAVTAGSSAVAASNTGGGSLLQLGAILRSAGGSVDFTNPAGILGTTNGITTTAANNSAGILGGWATVGGTDWAVSGGSASDPITAFSAYSGMVSTGGSGTTNYAITGAGTNLGGAVTINSLKVTDTAASQSLSLAGNSLTFSGSAGGLLYAGGTNNAYTIYGGNGVDGTGVIGGGAGADNEFLVNVKAGSTLTITAAIINTGAASTGFLTTAGGGTLILNSSHGSTFSGTNYLNAGIVQIAQDANLGTGSLAMNGSTLQLASGGSYGGGALFANNRGIELGNNGGTIDTNGSSVAYGGVISGGVVNSINANTAGGFSLTKSGLGTLTLSGANTYGGATIINGGVLSVDALNVIQGANGGGGASGIGQAPNTAPYLILDGGVLRYTGGAATTDRQFTLGAAGGGLDASGVSGALNWAGNTGSGNTAANAVAFSGNGARTFTLSGNNTGANTFAMVVGNGAGGATSVTKNGAGNWTLTAANTYTGATTVNAGTLIISSEGSLASSNVNVAGGKFLYNNNTTAYAGGVAVSGTFGGSGRINGQISGSGLVGPGNSPGVLTVGSANPTGGLDFAFEFTATGSPVYGNNTASVNDVLRLTDGTPFTASLTSSNTINVFLNMDLGTLSDGDTIRGGFYTDNSASFLSSISGATFVYYAAAGGGSVIYEGTAYDLYSGPLGFNVSTVADTANFGSGAVNGYVTEFTVVPEPRTWALLGLGFGVLIWRTRARKSLANR